MMTESLSHSAPSAKVKPVRPAPPTEEEFAEEIVRECRAMLRYALDQGIPLPADILPATNLLAGPIGADGLSKVVSLHNRLGIVIAPATPRSVWLIQTDAGRNTFWGLIGSIRNIRWMLGATIVFLMLFLGVGLTKQVNDLNVAKDILSLEGTELLFVLLFLIGAAGLGACFNALYTAHSYVTQGTYDPRHDSTYWIKIVLGIVSGVLLSQVLPVGQPPPDLVAQALSLLRELKDTVVEADRQAILMELSSLLPMLKQQVEAPIIPSNQLADQLHIQNSMVKPLLALVGGFSADLVNTILKRLTDTIQSLFKGDAEALQVARETAAQSRMDREMSEQRLAAATEVISLREAIAAGAPTERLQELAELAMQRLTPTSTTSHQNGSTP